MFETKPQGGAHTLDSMIETRELIPRGLVGAAHCHAEADADTRGDASYVLYAEVKTCVNNAILRTESSGVVRWTRTASSEHNRIDKSQHLGFTIVLVVGNRYW